MKKAEATLEKLLPTSLRSLEIPITAAYYHSVSPQPLGLSSSYSLIHHALFPLV